MPGRSTKNGLPMLIMVYDVYIYIYILYYV